MNKQLYTFKAAAVFCMLLFVSTFSTAQDWEAIETPVTSNLILYQITFPAGQNTIGYTGGAHQTYNGHGKILKTTDNGASWEVIWEMDVNATGVSAITFLDPQNGFAGTQGGDLMITTDGGDTWTTTDFDPTTDQGEIKDIEFYDTDNGVILTAWGGAYITADGGDTWTQATVNIPGASHEIAYADASTLFAVGNQQKVFKSSDGGHNWTTNYSGPSPWYITTGVHFADANHGMVTSEDGELSVTHDGGDTWSNYIVPGQGGLMRGALVVDENTMYITATPGAVYKSVNGGVDWTLDSPVDPQPSYYTIVMTDNGSLFVSGSGSTGGTILRKTVSVPLSVTADVFDAYCAGENSGWIDLNVLGGTEPYTYEWSTGETSQSIINLTAGEYSCTVTDATGATITIENLIVNEPDPIVAVGSTTDESVLGANDGTVSLDTITGGVAFYEFLWSNGATTTSLINLSPGVYCVTITDANGCTLEWCGEVQAGTVSNNDISNLEFFEVYPNPISEEGQLLIQLQFQSPSNIRIELIDAKGKVYPVSEDADVLDLSRRVDLKDYSSGLYLIRVVDLDSGQFSYKKVLKM